MNIALYQPDIPQNAGALLRLGACLDVAVHIVEPCGFLLDDRRLRRAGMDYIERARLVRHISWEAFLSDRPPGRLVLLSTRAADTYQTFRFDAADTLLLGRESSGVPTPVREIADACVRIPTASGTRSLNVALAAAMVLGEALRQLDDFPKPR